MRLNATSCLGFGILFALMPQTIALFLGDVSPIFIRIIGIGLALNGIHLIIGSLRKSISRLELSYFILGDVIWVIGSIILLTCFPNVIQGQTAILSTILTAALVGFFAVLQARFGWKILSFINNPI